MRRLAGCVFGVLVCNVQPYSRGQLVPVSGLRESGERSGSRRAGESEALRGVQETLTTTTTTTTTTAAATTRENNNMKENTTSDNNNNNRDPALSNNTLPDSHYYPPLPLPSRQLWPLPLRLDANYYDDDRDALVMFNAMKGQPPPPPTHIYMPPPPYISVTTMMIVTLWSP